MKRQSTTEFPRSLDSSVLAQDSIEELKDRTVIGPSMSIQGEVSGKGAITVHGQVKGRIDLRNHTVTVGKNGRVKANIVGKMISIEGQVRGNLYGADKIIIRETGNVRGDIVAPRVNLEDGSKFKGRMEVDSTASAEPSWMRDASPQPLSQLRAKEPGDR